MSFTYGNIASLSTQTSMAVGTATANTYGLSKQEGQALAVTNMLEKDDDKSLVSSLMGSGKKSKSGLLNKKDLMAIGGAAIHQAGGGLGLNANGSGGIIGIKV